MLQNKPLECCLMTSLDLFYQKLKYFVSRKTTLSTRILSDKICYINVGPYMYFCSSKMKLIFVSVPQSYVKCIYAYSITVFWGLNECFEVIIFRILISSRIFAILVLDKAEHDNDYFLKYGGWRLLNT